MDLGLQFDFVVRSTDSTGLNAIPLDLVQKANLLLEVKKAPLVWEMAVDIFAKSKRLPSFHNIQREAPARLFDLEKNYQRSYSFRRGAFWTWTEKKAIVLQRRGGLPVT